MSSGYEHFFRGKIAIGDKLAAERSIEELDRIYRYFERVGDRAGMHETQVRALSARNRARWSGHPEIARLFMDWLIAVE